MASGTNLDCPYSVGNASLGIVRVVGHYSFVGPGKRDGLLLRVAWFEGGHARIDPDRDERGPPVIVQRHPDAVQPRTGGEALRIVFKNIHTVLLSRHTRSDRDVKDLARVKQSAYEVGIVPEINRFPLALVSSFRESER